MAECRQIVKPTYCRTKGQGHSPAKNCVRQIQNILDRWFDAFRIGEHNCGLFVFKSQWQRIHLSHHKITVLRPWRVRQKWSFEFGSQLCNLCEIIRVIFLFNSWPLHGKLWKIWWNWNSDSQKDFQQNQNLVP